MFKQYIRNMSVYGHQLLIVIVAISLRFATSVKFPSTNGITVSGGMFRVGEQSKLDCNFIKWKQETISKVEWSLGYSGVSTNFFTYSSSGQKEINNNSPYFTVDQYSSAERTTGLMLRDDRETEVTVCCRVEAVRDSGYGDLKMVDNQKCSSFPVISGATVPELRLTVRDNHLRIGETLHYSCQVDNGGTADIVVSINGDEINRERYNNHLNSSTSVLNDHFNQNRDSLSLECSARNGDTVLVQKTQEIRRKVTPVYPQHTTQRTQMARSARFFSEPQAHVSHGNVPCHSYILVEEGSTEVSIVGWLTQGSVIKGELPADIQEFIAEHMNLRKIGNRYETTEEAVQVLNVLGYNGFSVVGMGTNILNRLTWTLERKYFEFHRNEL